MVITTTGIAFLLSTIGLAFCGIRFFEAFRNVGGLNSGNRSGMLLSTYFIATSIQHGIMAFGSIFFADNPEALYATFLLVNLLLVGLAALAIYMTLYILVPRYSPWPVILAILIFGIFVAGWSLISHPLPFLTASNSIDWNASPSLQLLINLLLIVSIGSPLLIFVKNYLLAPNRRVKIIFFVLTLVHLAGVINVSILFGRWFLGDGDFKNSIFNVILAIIGILFMTAFLFAPFFAKNRKKQA